ncbi:hypothetical protein GCM10007063_04290 [Lentibacillus kapialis]|uniref:Uncharacterized protein n=1 Tax=Lentibacillus kapialis TaxID=340214 RepID=A0A917PMV6_9BACI|nr:hypothetical protein GCM10007063_04290 [Lentibacillus kapialis]
MGDFISFSIRYKARRMPSFSNNVRKYKMVDLIRKASAFAIRRGECRVFLMKMSKALIPHSFIIVKYVINFQRNGNTVRKRGVDGHFFEKETFI